MQRWPLFHLKRSGGQMYRCSDGLSFILNIQEGKCIDVSVPGAIPNWFGAPVVKLDPPTQAQDSNQQESRAHFHQWQSAACAVQQKIYQSESASPSILSKSQSTYSLHFCCLYAFESNMVLGSLPCTSLQQQGTESHNALYITTVIVLSCFRFFHTENNTTIYLRLISNDNINVIAEFVHGQGPERLYENTCRKTDPIKRILVIYWLMIID